MLTNADLEQQYWQWRAALEQVPIDGTQTTNLMLSLSHHDEPRAFAWDRTVISAANDPMTDIVLPGS